MNHDTGTENFYAELPVLKQFIELTDSSRFVTAPDDWYVVLTDIVGSTQAIEAGKYKEVNMIGACSIVAILNIARELEIPFVFGGDGAALLIPPKLLQPAQQALIAVKQLSQQSLGLELRVGLVPVAIVQSRDPIKVAKLQISANYSQALFKGGGLTYATRLIKDQATAQFYQLETLTLQPEADLFGLECRWKDIPSPKGEIVTLMVQATAPSNSQMDAIYHLVIQQIQRIYGDESACHPALADQLQISLQTKQLQAETKLRAGKGWLARQLYLIKIRLENLLGLVLMRWNLKVGTTDWGTYREIVSQATDYKKFDDLLRLVISGTPAQRQKLLQFLETQYQQGKLVYGYHVSDRALMTCLVFERSGRQVHFVDGADGGYAYAAKVMKQKLAA